MARRSFTSLQTAAELRGASRELGALFRAAGARRSRARLQDGPMPVLVLPSHELWLIQHRLPNRHRNALGPGDPTGQGLVWPSVQLNLPLRPGGARPQARFVRDAGGALWVAHTGTLGGRQVGISRDGFLRFLEPTGLVTDLRIDDRDERLVLLGTFARAAPLLDAVARLVHGAYAFRSSLAAGLACA
jgi:hypothetical protein